MNGRLLTGDRRFFRYFISGAVPVVCFSISGQASANGPTVAAEVGADVVVSDLSDDNTLTAVGPAVALRLGYSFTAPMIRFTPEAKIAFESPGTPNAAALLGGARLNLFEGLSPAVFAHAGGLLGDIRGFVWDAGLGLDLALFRAFDIGIYGAYYQTGGGATLDFGNASVSSRNSYHWLQFGAQAALHF